MHLVSLSLSFVAVAFTAAADQLVVDAPVTSVIISVGGAMVQRDVSVDIPKGRHEIVFELPLDSIDPISLSTSLSSPFVTISSFGLRDRTLFGSPSSDPADLVAAKARRKDAEHVLFTLQDTQRTLLASVASAQARMTFLNSIQGSLEDGTPTISAGGVKSTATTIGEEYLAASLDIIRAETQARGLERDIQEASDAVDETSTHVAALERRYDHHLIPVLAVSSTENTTANLSISYLTPNASWESIYDVKLTQNGAEGDIELHRNAFINQSTNEDWIDVEVRLTTAAIEKAANVSLPTARSALQ